MPRLLAIEFIALMSLAAAPSAQEWPTVGDIIDDGQSIESPVLRQMLSENAAVLSFSLGAATFGQIVECSGEQSPSINFDSGFSNFRLVECRQSKNGLCLDGECYSFFSHPDWDMWFVEFDWPEENDLTAEEIADRRSQPAAAAAFVPLSIERLSKVEGEVDFGPYLLDLPRGLSLELGYVVGFPLTLSFGTGFTESNLTLVIEQIGWPRPYDLPKLREASETEAVAARQQIKEWEASHRTRDLGPDDWGTTYQIDNYRSEEKILRNGVCQKIVETMSVLENDLGVQISPAESWYARQICISPAAGAMAMVTLRINSPTENLDFEVLAEQANQIVDQMQLGWKSQR